MPTLNYRPPATVQQMLQSQAFIRAIMGPIGSGKSVGCVMALLQNAMQQTPHPETGIRRSRYVIIRNTYRMLRDTTLKTVHEWLPPGSAGQWKDSAMQYLIKFGDVETEWLFRALDSPDDMRNLLSLEITGAWINEFREIPQETLTNLLGRVGRFPRRADGGAVLRGIVMDSNPPAVGSYWHDLLELPPSEEVATALREAMTGADADRPIIQFFRQPGGRSPQAENVENLPDGYYPLLIAANAERGEEWVHVHVDGEYGQDPANTPVYPEFRADVHATEPGRTLLANPALPLLIGLDFGLTPSAVVTQYTPQGQWMVLAERVSENTGIERFAEALVPWLRSTFPDHQLTSARFFADPAGQHRSQTDEKTCYQILRSRGFTVIPGPQDPATRTGGVRRTLQRMVGGKPGMMVDRVRCPVVFKGFAGGYAYGRTREGEMKPAPKKNKFSHPHDALQYVVAWHEAGDLKSGGKTAIEKPIVRGPSWNVY